MTVNIAPLEPSQATGTALSLYQNLEKTLGAPPNLIKTLGHAPQLLEAYLSFSQVLSQSSLDPLTYSYILVL
jgi:hypothetical protein